MFRLCARLEIRGKRLWRLDHVTEVEISRSTEELTDTCRITLPKKIRWDGTERIPIVQGDSVRVWLGYDEQLTLAFVGYVREVSLKTPIVLTCEDEMFRLKQQPTLKKAYRSTTLTQLLQDQRIDYPLRVMGEQRLGAYRVKADTIASLLGHLRDNGVRSFFRYDGEQPTLYCGVLFPHEAQISQVFSTGCNIINDSRLEEQHAETMRLHIKAISLLPNNKKIKVEVGDADGEHRTLHTYNKTEAELRAWAEQEIQRLKRDGLKGSFTTFGHRLVDKLDSIALILDGRKMGVYQVQKNVIKYGGEGFRQEITLGARTAE